MKVTTPQTLKLIASLGTLEFRPMTASDYSCWADAAADAQIAFTDGPIAKLIGEMTKHDMEIGEVAIVISGGTIECAAIDEDGDCVSISFNLSRVI